MAGAVDVRVTADGKPVSDAVITAVPRSTPIPVSKTRPKAVMVQEQQQFAPFVLPVQVGTLVEFPNRDTFRHHVYSFSPAKSFELKLYGGGEVQSVVFDKEGVIALGCNIHDNMLAYVYVVPTPYFAKTRGEGNGEIVDLPAGTYTIAAWHPDQKNGPAQTQDIVVAADGTTRLSLTLNMKRDRKQRRPGAVDENAY